VAFSHEVSNKKGSSAMIGQEVQTAASASEAAALWWAGVLRDPALKSGIGFVDAVAATNEGPVQADDKLASFANLLAERLSARLSEEDAIILMVDYGPDKLLEECADLAELEDDICAWPWKTTMRVRCDEVAVINGFGGSPEVIWTRPPS
jgi:hypothetical protein